MIDDLFSLLVLFQFITTTGPPENPWLLWPSSKIISLFESESLKKHEIIAFLTNGIGKPWFTCLSFLLSCILNPARGKPRKKHSCDKKYSEPPMSKPFSLTSFDFKSITAISIQGLS